MSNFKSKFTVSLIFLVIFLSVAAFVRAQQYQKQEILDVNLHYKDKQVSVVFIEKRLGFLPDYRNQPEKGYTAVLQDKRNEELFKVLFDFPLYQFVDTFDKKTPEGGLIVRNEVDYTLALPYMGNATKLTISDPDGQTLITKELTKEALVVPKAEVKKEGILARIGNWFKGFFAKIGSFFKNIFPKKESQKQVSVSPTPTLDADIQKIAKLAPFTTDFMTILYFDKSQSFLVTIEKAPFDTSKKLALDWFSDHGVVDLCKLNLEFTASTVVKKRGTLTQEERSTPGCALLPQT